MRNVRTWAVVVALGGGLTGLVGCEEAKTKSSELKQQAADLKKDGAKALDQAKDKVEAAAKDVKAGADDLVKAAKETFLKPVTAMVGQAEEKIKSLMADEGKATGDAKKVLTEKIAKAKELLPKIQEKIKAITEASGDKWEAIKEELTKLASDLKATLGL